MNECQPLTRKISKPGGMGNLNFCTFTQNSFGLISWSSEIRYDNLQVTVTQIYQVL